MKDHELVGRVRAILVAAIVVPLLIAGGALVFWRGYWGPPVVIVTNESGSVVRNVVVDGDGCPWSQRLPDLAPTLVSEDVTLKASPVKLVARSCASMSAVFGPKKFTVPLLSKGKILEKMG